MRQKWIKRGYLKKNDYSPVKDPRLLQHISQVDVGVEKVGIQGDRFLEVMYRQPDLALCVKYTAKIAPCDGKVRARLNRFQVARLKATDNRRLDISICRRRMATQEHV